jgi:hypothetical protein
MAWFYILFADLFEIAWPFVLKWSAPISRWAPLLVVIICAFPPIITQLVVSNADYLRNVEQRELLMSGLRLAAGEAQ